MFLAVPHVLLAAALVAHPSGAPRWITRHAAAAAPLSPDLRRAAAALRQPPRRSSPPVLSGGSLFANDGGEVDWDKEAGKLALPTNEYVRAVKAMKLPELVEEFAKTAPPPVQLAVKQTVAQLLGQMPPEIAGGAVRGPGTSLATLFVSMQMTGYMFRNAEYRRQLRSSLNGADSTGSDLIAPILAGGEAPARLPPIKGEIAVSLGPGLEAKVDAAAYMAELRAEVDSLRVQLASARKARENESLISFMQRLPPNELMQLQGSISAEVLEAMGELVTSLLRGIKVDPDDVAEASVDKMREMLIVQLVQGYKLRELEVKNELKARFWDQ